MKSLINFSVLIKKFFSTAVFILCISSVLYSQEYTERDWRYFHERGVKQFNAGMYNDSYDSMLKAIKRNPGSYESLNILAKIAMMNKNRKLAIEYLEKSLEVNSRQSGVHNSLGELYDFFGRDEAAFSHYKIGYELDNTNLRVMINYSRYMRKRGDNAEADRLFALCKDAAIKSSSPLLEKGRSLTKLRPSEAESLYRKAIELNPAHIDAYIVLADLLRQEKRYENAAETIEELKRIKSDYAPAYFYLGNIYYDNSLRGRSRDRCIKLAISNIEEGLKLDPSSVDDWFHLAEIYRHIGNRERAAEAEKTAVDLLKKREQATQ